MKYPNRLRVLRAAKKKPNSQLDISIKAKIKLYRYWRIENGYEVPTPEERARIAKALGVTTDHLEPPQQQAIAS